MKAKIAFLLSVLFSSTAIANQTIEWSGFASIRGGFLSDDLNTPIYFNRYQDKDFTLKKESLFAIQADTDLGNNLSAAVQLMAKGDNDFDVEAQWAYIKYQFDDHSQILAGRFNIPIFRNSDTVDIGYVHNLSRLSPAVYLPLDISIIEGIRFNYQNYYDQWHYQIVSSFGSWDGDIVTQAAGNVQTDIDSVLQLSIEVENDGLTLFAGMTHTTFESEEYDHKLIDGLLRQVGVYDELVAQDYDFKRIYLSDTETSVRYLMAGIYYEKGPWFANSEITSLIAFNSIDQKNEAWQMTLGRKFGEYQIALSQEQNRQINDSTSFYKVENPITQAKLMLINDLVSEITEFEATSLHFRYDFHPQAALTSSLANFEFSNSEYHQDNGEDKSDAILFTIGIDLIF
ncbi:hypothetical protein HR060_12645 [Catenovulum sp. SM1970]|uniref:hypothetical protein n=1 Tax=Marinifaba aquimaris TaxID=2741323 RepID=UPI001574B4C8|nr:hypothetical protein [Marinifaba aquimaris]NTS77710.1 hypothetical protein [Marinifaba aquimaris]